MQANVGSYNRCFSQVLNWYAYFYSRYPNQQAFSRIVFPYNPYGEIDFGQEQLEEAGLWSPTMKVGFKTISGIFALD